ncbi:MAG: PorT family protein [Saprospiraceae bacterium]|nr:PorT family protein [Saprospiraceae bacterium]
MKKLIFVVFAALLWLPLTAQLSFGLKAGVGTTDVDVTALKVGQGAADELVFQLENANFGLHAGIFIQAKIGSFLIQPEVLFNSSSADFRVTDNRSGQMVENILREKYQNLDIPLMMGFKLGPVRLMGGPVGHIFLQSESELTSVDGYEQMFDKLTYGWQAGLGIDIWKIMIDLRYEGNFDNYGNHISVGGTHYSFDKAPSRIIGSIGFRF